MIESYLKEIVDLLETMNNRLESLERKISEAGGVAIKDEKTVVSSIDIFTRVPKSHRKTYFTLQKLGEATCTEVAEITKRSHNLESRYLSRLYEEGFLDRKRVPLANKNKPGTEVKYFLRSVE